LATSAAAAPVGSTAVIEKSAARVNGAVIWESELAARAAADPKGRAVVLETMIDEELIIAEGRRSGVETDAAEVNAALDEIKTQNNLDDKALDAVLAQQGYSRARYMLDLERQLIFLRTKNQLVAPKVDVTDADVEAEAKKRGIAKLADADKTTITRELRRKQLDEKTAEWVIELRKRAWIERRK
jgi:parvulin-like peptidyl-prolyl isomerase